MVLMGILMFTGKMNDVTGYLSRISGTQVSQTESMEESTAPEKAEADNEGGSTEPGTGGSESTTAEEASGETAADARPVIPAVDFELEDQYGNIHRLEDYRGKTIFLNFWATWCPPCKAEMPDIQKLYEKSSTEGEDAVIVLGVAAPNMGQEGSEEEIAAFMEEKGYTYPVLMDTEGELFASYGIMSFPTTFMIDRDGNVFGYVSGMLSADMMDSIVRQTLDGKMDQR